MYQLDFLVDQIKVYQDGKLHAAYSPNPTCNKNEKLLAALDAIITDVPADIDITGNYDGWNMGLVTGFISGKVRLFSITFPPEYDYD